MLSQVSSSSAIKRKWSTYSYIHSVKRNRLTSKRAEKFVVVHGFLRLKDRKIHEYKESPVAQWDVEPEDPTQIDEDDDAIEADVGLVGVPLEDQNLTHEESSNSSDEGFNIGDD